MPVFLLKLGLIAAAVANFLVFARSTGQERGGVPRRLCACRRRPSIVLWLGVLLCGRFIGFL